MKLGNEFQYVLNPKGTTPSEIMGIDYKSKLKPALNSYADDIQKSSMAKLEELISLQQQSKENAAKIEGKRNHITALQSRIEEVSASGLGLCTMRLMGGSYTFLILFYTCVFTYLPVKILQGVGTFFFLGGGGGVINFLCYQWEGHKLYAFNLICIHEF